MHLDAKSLSKMSTLRANPILRQTPWALEITCAVGDLSLASLLELQASVNDQAFSPPRALTVCFLGSPALHSNFTLRAHPSSSLSSVPGSARFSLPFLNSVIILLSSFCPLS